MDKPSDIEELARMRGDGQPYSERFEKEYSKMTPEEQAKRDAFKEQLRKILGDDDD